MEAKLKITPVETWKAKHLAEVNHKLKAGESDTVKSLPVKIREKSLLLGEKLGSEAKSYIQAVHEEVGVVTISITIMANFIKRRGSSKLTVTNLNGVQEQFIINVNAVVEIEDIPPQFVINWDQTSISIVPGSSWTMEAKGSRQVKIVEMGKKRQITDVFCGVLSGKFLSPQLIYQGKNRRLSALSQISKWLYVPYTPNHWSNKAKMIEYMESIILQYVEHTCKELKCSSDQPALAICNVFKGQQTKRSEIAG